MEIYAEPYNCIAQVPNIDDNTYRIPLSFSLRRVPSSHVVSDYVVVLKTVKPKYTTVFKSYNKYCAKKNPPLKVTGFNSEFNSKRINNKHIKYNKNHAKLQ